MGLPRPDDSDGSPVYQASAHRMHVAKPSPRTARRYGLSANHSLRVWCECMSQQSSPGDWAGSDQACVNERTRAQAVGDPRRLGGWDHLEVVDMREPGSAVRAFTEHVQASKQG